MLASRITFISALGKGLSSSVIYFSLTLKLLANSLGELSLG